jgi:hypothetical protein
MKGEGLTGDLWVTVEACRSLPIDAFYSSLTCELLADKVDGWVMDFKEQVILACGGIRASARLRR